MLNGLEKEKLTERNNVKGGKLLNLILKINHL